MPQLAVGGADNAKRLSSRATLTWHDTYVTTGILLVDQQPISGNGFLTGVGPGSSSRSFFMMGCFQVIANTYFPCRLIVRGLRNVWQLRNSGKNCPHPRLSRSHGRGTG